MSQPTTSSEYPLLAVAVLMAVLFCTFVIGVAQVIGTQFALPNGRIFTIIGVHSAIPVSFALLSYAVYQAIRGNLWNRDALRRIAVDMGFTLLISVTYYFHLHLKIWVPLVNATSNDAFLYQTDLALAPLSNLLLPLREVAQKIPNADQFYQLIYMQIFMVALLLTAYESRATFQRFAFAFLTVLILGGLGYIAFPALGPFLYEAGFNAKATEAQQGLLEWHMVLKTNGTGWLNAHMADFFGASLAAMPSLHVAFSFLICWAMWKIYRNGLVRGIFGLFFVLVICESVWSKWHYWIDAPAGVFIALCGLWLGNKVMRNSHDEN